MVKNERQLTATQDGGFEIDADDAFSQIAAAIDEVLTKCPKTAENIEYSATSSFWQGVDVRGDQLSCVIIDKLPFAVPSDPVVAARSRYIDENGGKSFFEYSVPTAIISLKQGIGRLIRSKTDRGVIALLDSRLRTKSYGREFLNSLPKAPITTELREVEEMFSEKSRAA